MADAIFQAHAAFCCGLLGVAYWRWKETWEGLFANRKPSGSEWNVLYCPNARFT